MRPPRVPYEIVYQKVWASLCEWMTPEMHLVRPQWKKMMREIGTSRQAIANAVKSLKAEGKIESVDEKVRKGNRDWNVTYYRVVGGWWLVAGAWWLVVYENAE